MPFSPASASRLGLPPRPPASGKLAPLIALVISALGLFAPAAHAQGSQPPGGYTPAPGQGWVLYKYTQSASNTGGQLWPVPVPSVVMANANPNGVIGAGCQGGTGLTDTITPYFYWSGPGLAPQISEKLRGTATAQAFADMSLPPSLAHSGTASDGLGDAQVPQSQQIGVSSAGLHLLPVPNSQGAAYGTVVAGPAVTLSAGTPGAGTLAVNLSAAPDTRGLTLSANIDPTNKKVPVLDANGNQTVDANGDPNYTTASNVADADGTMHGDTLYSYYMFQTNPSNTEPSMTEVPVVNEVDFTPNFVGNWHWKTIIYNPFTGAGATVPDVVDPDTWNWSLSESNDTWDQGIWKMPYAQNFSYLNGDPNGSDSPSSYTLTYKATDNTDGAQAAASYVMTRHDPLENNYPDHQKHIVTNFRPVADAAYARAAYDKQTLTVGVTQGDSWTVTGSISGPVAKYVLGTLNLSGQISRQYSFSSTVNSSVTDPPISISAGDETYMEEFDQYVEHSGKVDTWGISGYGGTSAYDFTVPDNPSGGYQAHLPLIHTGTSNSRS